MLHARKEGKQDAKEAINKELKKPTVCTRNNYKKGIGPDERLQAMVDVAGLDMIFSWTGATTC